MLTLVCNHHTLISIDTGGKGFSDELDVALLMPGEVTNHDFLFSEDALQKAR